MRAKELRERSVADLQQMIEDEKANIFNNRLKNATHQLDDTSSLNKSRREIARINTVLAEKAKEGAE